MKMYLYKSFVRVLVQYDSWFLFTPYPVQQDSVYPQTTGVEISQKEVKQRHKVYK
jgi:hypothetical protein